MTFLSLVGFLLLVCWKAHCEKCGPQLVPYTKGKSRRPCFWMLWSRKKEENDHLSMYFAPAASQPSLQTVLNWFVVLWDLSFWCTVFLNPKGIKKQDCSNFLLLFLEKRCQIKTWILKRKELLNVKHWLEYVKEKTK